MAPTVYLKMNTRNLFELPYRITNGACEHYKDRCIFLFGFDVMGKSMDGQATIYGHENTFPIPVMYKFCNSGARYFTDSDSQCKVRIDEALDKAVAEAKGRCIIPLRKMGEGCSRLSELSPFNYKHLQARLAKIKHENIVWRYDW